MPGSGKSTIGKTLATKLELLFFDLDDEIVLDQGKEITEIFNDRGEVYFRTLEHEMLKKITSCNASFVMATGGGTPCYNNGIRLMNAVGKTFFLETSLVNLLQRVSKTSNRPILGNDYQKALQELLFDRKECYGQANFKLPTDALSIQEIANSIEDIITLYITNIS